MMTQAMADVIGKCADWDGAADFASKLSAEEYSTALTAAVKAGYVYMIDDEYFATSEGTEAVFAAMDTGKVVR